MDKEYVMRVAGTAGNDDRHAGPYVMGHRGVYGNSIQEPAGTEIPCKRKTLPRGSADLSERLGLL